MTHDATPLQPPEPHPAGRDRPEPATTADSNDADDWWFDDPRSPRHQEGTKKSLRTWIAAGAGALLLAAGAIAGVSALSSSDSLANATAGNNGPRGAGGFPGGRQGMPGGLGTAGTISHIAGSSFTLNTTTDDSVDVTTKADTTVVEATSGSISDIKQGDHVVVFGTTADNKIAASRITSGDTDTLRGPGGGPGQGGPPSGRAPGGNGAPPNGGPAGPRDRSGIPTAGVVTSVDGSTLKIETDANTTITVTTSSSTEVQLQHTTSVSNLKIGDDVTVNGTTTDGTVAATNIRVGALNEMPGMTPPSAGVTASRSASGDSGPGASGSG